jgi:hypothetical protein
VSKGKVFTEQDLAEPKEGITPDVGDVDMDMLDKINDLVTNIDKLATDLVSIREKHPDIMDKFRRLGGQNRFNTAQGQFSPYRQPADSYSGRQGSQNISAKKLYTLLLGVLHKCEGQNLTVEQLKHFLIQNKDKVIAELEKALPALME